MHSAAQECVFLRIWNTSPCHNQLEIQLYFLTNTTTKGSKRFHFPCFCWELVIQVFIWLGQVALQVSLPEIDGAIEPLIFSGRDGTSGRSIPMQVPSVWQGDSWWDNMERGGNKWVEAKQFEEWPYIAILDFVQCFIHRVYHDFNMWIVIGWSVKFWHNNKNKKSIPRWWCNFLLVFWTGFWVFDQVVRGAFRAWANDPASSFFWNV